MVNRCEQNNINIYPHKFQLSSSLPQFLINYQKIAINEELDSTSVSIAGRVMNIRKSGSKLRFYDIQADGHSLQVVANASNGKTVEAFKLQHVNIRRGDIIGIEGFPGKTKAGELSIFATNTLLLAPCLRMLPSSKHGHMLTDKETRYRQRYLDLILRSKVLFFKQNNILLIVFSDQRNILYSFKNNKLYSSFSGQSWFLRSRNTNA